MILVEPPVSRIKTFARGVPATAGKTTLPKQTLSYRWIITDADKFLWKVDRELSLRSPIFSTSLPLINAKPSWSLLIEKEQQWYSTSTSISLWEGDDNTPKDRLPILISECTFSFLNPETYEVKYSITAPSDTCCVPFPSQCKCIEQRIEYNKIMQCIFNGTLTIQVNANLVCTTDPKEKIQHTHMVPLSNLRSEMHSLYKAEVFTDATIKCGGREFKVHRAVLGSQSPVFKAMLQADMKEKRSNIIDISDITSTVMCDVVAYLYTGTAPNVSTLAKELLNVANKYQLPRLFTMCENELKMKIKVANVVDTLLLADLHGAVDLKKACFNFIRLHSVEVYNTSKWKYLKDNLDRYAALVFEALE